MKRIVDNFMYNDMCVNKDIDKERDLTLSEL